MRALAGGLHRARVGTLFASSDPHRGCAALPSGFLDGTGFTVDAFVEAAITGEQPPMIAEEGYYASLLCLWGHEAIDRGEVLLFPEQYKIDYEPYGTRRQTIPTT